MVRDVPLRCREEQGKSRPAAGRRALVWVCLGVCSVVLIKAVVLGGLGSETFSLLDPRYGGVDGLGVLSSHTAVPARQEQLTTVGRSMDSFRTARGNIVPSGGVGGSVFGDDASGKLPGVNQNAWLASKTGQGVHFFSSKAHFVRAAPHPRRPSMLRRVDIATEGASARTTPSALVRMVSRNNLLKEKVNFAGLGRRSALGALASLPSQQSRNSQHFDNAAGGALSRAGTTSTSTDGSLSPDFESDVGNANGALAAVHGDRSWAQPTHDNGWASTANDNGWATSVKDDGWAAESKQNGWASGVQDDGWASSPSAAASHGALMAVKSGNPMGSLSQVKGHQDGWAQRPSRSDDAGALASMWSGNNRGSLTAVHGGEDGMGSLAHVPMGNSMGSLAEVHGGEDGLGSLAHVKGGSSMGSLALMKADPETNGDLSNFEQNQAETDGSLSSFRDSLGATDGALAGLKGSNSAGSLANTRGSDADGSLSHVKGSNMLGSLSNAKGNDLANGVLSVIDNKQDVGGSLSGFKYGKQGEQVGGSLADTIGSDAGGSPSAVESNMVNGALSAVGDQHGNEMVGGSLSAVRDRPQGNGWLSQAPGLRGRAVERSEADAAKGGQTDASTRQFVAAKGARHEIVESQKQVQQTEQEAAALKYMLGKELSEAAQKRAALQAEKKVKSQEEALENLLKASKKKVEQVQSKIVRAAQVAGKAKIKSKAAPAIAPAKPLGKGASVRSEASSKHVRKMVSSMHDTMHVARGQQKKQQKLDEEGEPLDGNEDDIGWHKTHWTTVAWVMFIMFGPVFTTAVVGLVGYYTGTVAAAATCLLLVCMDIACYYYSWFLW